MCFPGSQWERGFPGCRQPLTPQESQCGPDLTNGRWTPEKDGHFLVVPEARLKKKKKYLEAALLARLFGTLLRCLKSRGRNPGHSSEKSFVMSQLRLVFTVPLSVSVHKLRLYFKVQNS